MGTDRFHEGDANDARCRSSHPCGAATARRAGLCADPGATSGRSHNRRKSNQPMSQVASNSITGHRTTPAAMISHCFQIETLPMA
jgi:hypothetical protein